MICMLWQTTRTLTTHGFSNSGLSFTRGLCEEICEDEHKISLPDREDFDVQLLMVLGLVPFWNSNDLHALADDPRIDSPRIF